ncbi:MAG: hypothetical protein KUG82_01295 [Pseudomonadales bacterium]|nr:hypothetical protein [Pseudomonadales bacterium]
MPTVEGFRQQGYYPATANLSQNVRSFAVAGIGIVWLFSSKITVTDLEFTLPLEFMKVVWLMAITLCFDFLQYLYQAIFWGWYCSKKEREFKKTEMGEKTEFEVNPCFNMPTQLFFLIKILILGYAYIELFIILNSRISFREVLPI